MRTILSTRRLRPQAGQIGLMILVLLATPWAAAARSLWCSPFETEGGAAVAHDQTADVVDNLVGPAGQALLGMLDPAGCGAAPDPLCPMIYIEHGSFIPAIPASIDPAGQAGSFALSAPDDRRTGISTNLKSTTGNLLNSLTFEGYFYLPSADLVTSPSFVGRRLVSQKRSALDDNTRLAIGVHGESKLVGYVDGLFEYEGFDYLVSEDPVLLAGQNGGIGWGDAWINSANNYQVMSGSLSSPVSPFTPIGGRARVSGAVAVRKLSRFVDLSKDGNALYFSALWRKDANVGGSNLEINFTPASSGTQTTRFGMTSGGAFFLNVSSNTGGTVVPNETYFVVGRILSRAGSPDEVAMNAYGPADSLPTAEPETWLLTSQINSNTVLEHVRLVVGAGTNGEFDDIRIGSTWESVVDPDAQLGDKGEIEAHNRLSVFWAEQVPGDLPEDPPVTVNHLEFGTTPLQANTWYHFALTYDGADIRWYLDGEMEGLVPAPPATDLSPGLHPAGPARIAIANNRIAGVADRGFFGVIDEIRIWEMALEPSQMLVGGGTPGAGLLWQSEFETDAGQPVTQQQPAQTPFGITNSAGLPHGTPSGVIVSSYAGYGQADLPAVPASLDPAGLTGAFALQLPDMRNAGVNSKVPSNAGNLNNAITIQGYFNNSEELPATAPDFVARRLVTQKRSDSDAQSRLAIGLHAAGEPAANRLAVYWHGADNSQNVRLGTTEIQANTWYHFALTYDGTFIRWYLDGNLEGKIAAALAPAGSATIGIGNERTIAGDGQRGLYGFLDKIAVTDHVVDPDRFMTAGFDPCVVVWCNQPSVDWDGDKDVDQDDFGAFQLCLNPEAVLDEEDKCLCFDKSGDQVVDINDLEAFEKCSTGPSVHWSQELTPDCVP